MSEPLALGPDEKLCPYCAETIKKAAIKCRYCHSDLGGTDESAPQPPPPSARPSPQSVAAETDLAPTHERIPSRAERRHAKESSSEVSADGLDPVAPRRFPALAGFRLMVTLVVLDLLLAAAAVTAVVVKNNQAEDGPSGAIASAQAREAGLQQASTLTKKVLSYDWKTLDSDIKSSEAVLAPSFRSEYAKTMAGVRDQTVKNQVKLTAQVVAASVVSATEDKVRALVFVNQVTTAKGTTNQRLDQNRVLVTLTRDGGKWRVSRMDAF